jgi:hypothetical protein
LGTLTFCFTGAADELGDADLDEALEDEADDDELLAASDDAEKSDADIDESFGLGSADCCGAQAVNANAAKRSAIAATHAITLDTDDNLLIMPSSVWFSICF